MWVLLGSTCNAWRGAVHLLLLLLLLLLPMLRIVLPPSSRPRLLPRLAGPPRLPRSLLASPPRLRLRVLRVRAFLVLLGVLLPLLLGVAG